MTQQPSQPEMILATFNEEKVQNSQPLPLLGNYQSQKNASDKIISMASQNTKVYDTDDSQASALYVTQLNSLLQSGDRRRSLAHFYQCRKTETTLHKEGDKELQVLVKASERLISTSFDSILS